ncbi:MAG TPA: folate-binding protein YgfZ, partial [Cyanobacteria bacterium UBA11148]|nr:folate-binding protein YgfZ [Cyanobacteria bacterium UBA11148]
TDLSSNNCVFSLIGSESDALLEKLGVSMPIGEDYASHQQVRVENCSVRIAVGNGLALPGYTLIFAANEAA